MSKRAIILAGGKGTRLKPYTVILPKPLMPVGDYPILEIIIRQLVYYGFSHITLTVNHQAEIIRAFFGDGSKWNIKIDYSYEDKPLSTMGPLRLIPDLPENFLVMNGDVLTNLNFKNFFESHVNRKRLFTISAYNRVEISEYGVLEMDAENHLCGFVEKPKRNYVVSMGIYMINRSVLNHIPEGVAYGFDHLMLDLLAKKQKIQVCPFSGYWLDIGRPDDYQQAVEESEKYRKILMPWE